MVVAITPLEEEPVTRTVDPADPQGPSFLTHVMAVPADGIRRTGRARVFIRLTRDRVSMGPHSDVLAFDGQRPMLASDPLYGKGASRYLGRKVRTERVK